MNWAGIVAYAAGASVFATLVGRLMGRVAVDYPKPPHFDRERAIRTLLDVAHPPTHPAPATNPGNEVRQNA